MRNSIVFALALTLTLASAAFAADPPPAQPRELAFKVLDAKVEKIDPPQRTRRGKYDQALVLRLEVDRAEWNKLPRASETLLYIGTHELPPFANVLDGPRVVITYHDPNWQDLKGGEPMVLTTRHGDPLVNPDRYKDYPRFDPAIITEK